MEPSMPPVKAPKPEKKFNLSETTQTYELTLDQMKDVIMDALGLDEPSNVSVTYVEGDVGLGDPMDRFPAPRGVVSIKVRVVK